MKKWTFVALLLVGATILGSTVLHDPIANAAQNVGATIIGPLDANGNVKVHEQGTANVNVTNGSIAVAEPAPITDGGIGAEFVCGNTITPDDTVATALTIHMEPGVFAVRFYLGELSNTSAFFLGPEETGPSDVQLTLNRPIRFDHVACIGLDTARMSVSWVGNTS